LGTPLNFRGKKKAFLKEERGKGEFRREFNPTFSPKGKGEGFGRRNWV